MHSSIAKPHTATVQISVNELMQASETLEMTFIPLGRGDTIAYFAFKILGGSYCVATLKALSIQRKIVAVLSLLSSSQLSLKLEEHSLTHPENCSTS